MRKLFLKISGLGIFSLVLLLSLPFIVFAADNITLTPTTNVYLSGIAKTFTINGDADTIAVNETTITITTCAGCQVRIESSNRLYLNNSVGANLFCETNYSYIVVGGAEGDTVTVTPTNDVCLAAGSAPGPGGGGGTPVVTPSNTSISINSGAAQTTSRNVTLTIAASNASLMLVSNYSNFLGATVWDDYTASKSWILLEGEGTKTVYIKYRSSTGGESSVTSDTITYAPTTEDEEADEEADEEVVEESEYEGNLVKGSGSSAVYLVQDGEKRPFYNADAFTSRGYSWSSIETIDNIDSLPTGDYLYKLPKVRDLVKGTSSEVYFLAPSFIKRWIATGDVFAGLGYDWLNIKLVNNELITGYESGDDITSSDVHPGGSLIMYDGDPKVYLVDNGKKKWISTAEAFLQRNYDWNHIIVISDDETYPDGENIGGQVLGVEYSEIFVSLLKVGSSGDEVKALQNKLRGLGYFPQSQVATGFFGSLTEAGVMEFQKANGIEAVGFVGPATREALNSL